MALTAITEQDGNVLVFGTREETAKIFQDISGNATIIQTPGSDLVLVDRGTISNAGLLTWAGALTVTGAVIASSTCYITGAATIMSTLTAGADGVGSDGEQLTSGGAAAECDWAAAGSLRRFKELLGLRTDVERVLEMVKETPVYDFRYRKGVDGEHVISTGDRETVYTGPVAEEAPWAMHHKGKILNPVNTFGYTLLALKGLLERMERLEAKLA